MLARSIVVITSLVLCGGLGGCASIPRKPAPCYDGWKSDGKDGSSHRLRDQALLAELEATFIPRGRALSCAHVSFDGSIILLFFDPPFMRFTTVLRGSDGRFVVIEEGALV